MRDRAAALRWHGADAAPYPERREARETGFDRAFGERWRRTAARFGGGAKALAARASEVEAHDASFAALDEDGLRRAASDLRSPLARRGFEPETVARSFALIREISARRLGLKHHRVQIMAALALMDGALAEMHTGEGKTITAALCAGTAALAGLPTHVVTVNDYLAARDAETLRPIYETLGLNLGIVQHGQTPDERRAAYACDVAYAVNKEIAFDYLRDGLALGARRSRSARLVEALRDVPAAAPLLRGLFFAIVDEADSILIDEARTPLIISGEADGGTWAEAAALALAVAARLERDRDFTFAGEGDRAVRLTPAGEDRIGTELTGFGGLWKARRAREELVRNALAARHLYERDKHYVVRDGKVEIVDEHSGRIAEGRAWQNGLHQVIEAKEGVALTAARNARASITYQRFFGRYLHLSGMSGTLSDVAGELRAVYGLRTVRIPTHRPSLRRDGGLRLLADGERKRAAIVAAASAYRAEGRPVLVGTRSIEASTELSLALDRAGLPHAVLNAHHDAQEAEIVALAGEAGRITVATSMAGRGTDIKLGPGTARVGGLAVILTEFHESRRIDRQLVGRGGRQGDPSSHEAIVALDDEIFRDFAGRFGRIVADALIGLRPALAGRFLQRIAQGRAGRVQARQRRDTLREQRRLDESLGFTERE